jgi:quinol monooxygenase YgiN
VLELVQLRVRQTTGDPRVRLCEPRRSLYSAAMIVIIGTMKVEPSDRDALLEAAKDVMAETLKEDGCLHYCFTADLLDPSVVHVVERWESEAPLEPHMKTEHIRTFGRALKPLTLHGRDFTIYEVASEKKMR